jgi:hypothetical protein
MGSERVSIVPISAVFSSNAPGLDKFRVSEATINYGIGMPTLVRVSGYLGESSSGEVEVIDPATMFRRLEAIQTYIYKEPKEKADSHLKVKVGSKTAYDGDLLLQGVDITVSSDGAVQVELQLGDESALASGWIGSVYNRRPLLESPRSGALSGEDFLQRAKNATSFAQLAEMILDEIEVRFFEAGNLAKAKIVQGIVAEKQAEVIHKRNLNFVKFIKNALKYSYNTTAIDEFAEWNVHSRNTMITDMVTAITETRNGVDLLLGSQLSSAFGFVAFSTGYGAQWAVVDKQMMDASMAVNLEETESGMFGSLTAAFGSEEAAPLGCVTMLSLFKPPAREVSLAVSDRETTFFQYPPNAENVLRVLRVNPPRWVSVAVEKEAIARAEVPTVVNPNPDAVVSESDATEQRLKKVYDEGATRCAKAWLRAAYYNASLQGSTAVVRVNGFPGTLAPCTRYKVHLRNVPVFTGVASRITHHVEVNENGTGTASTTANFVLVMADGFSLPDGDA